MKWALISHNKNQFLSLKSDKNIAILSILSSKFIIIQLWKAWKCFENEIHETNARIIITFIIQNYYNTSTRNEKIFWKKKLMKLQ